VSDVPTRHPQQQRRRLIHQQINVALM
jgi:hypothetical protein